MSVTLFILFGCLFCCVLFRNMAAHLWCPLKEKSHKTDDSLLCPMLLSLPKSLLHSFSSPVTQQLLLPPKALASSLSAECCAEMKARARMVCKAGLLSHTLCLLHWTNNLSQALNVSLASHPQGSMCWLELEP